MLSIASHIYRRSFDYVVITLLTQLFESLEHIPYGPMGRITISAGPSLQA